MVLPSSFVQDKAKRSGSGAGEEDRTPIGRTRKGSKTWGKASTSGGGGGSGKGKRSRARTASSSLRGDSPNNSQAGRASESPATAGRSLSGESRERSGSNPENDQEVNGEWRNPNTKPRSTAERRSRRSQSEAQLQIEREARELAARKEKEAEGARKAASKEVRSGGGGASGCRG